MTRASLALAWRSHRGLVRRRNEDAVSCLPDIGVVLVADGMGGAPAGDVASDTAVHVIGERFARQPPPVDAPDVAQRLAAAAIDEANDAIIRLAAQRQGCAGMGTTLVMGCFGADWLVHAHVGDSRLYRLRAGVLTQLTKDHSLIQEMVDQGLFSSLDEARRSGVNEHILTTALGATPRVEPAVAISNLAAGDRYLFCTDGLSGMLAPRELCAVLDTAGGLDSTAGTLVRAANAQGGADNITLALVRVDGLADRCTPAADG